MFVRAGHSIRVTFDACNSPAGPGLLLVMLGLAVFLSLMLSPRLCRWLKVVLGASCTERL